MKRKLLFSVMVLLFLMAAVFNVKADFVFEDSRFQGVFTTENLDTIIEAYELFDGWYWSTQADVEQDYHGHENCPGWTDTAVNQLKKKEFLRDWYGCRWKINRVKKYNPGQGGYGECFGFAQFIGYLLSGEINPQGRWRPYYSVEKAGGLRVGDIVRVEYTYQNRKYQHSAVVYEVKEDQVTFLQISSSCYNQISIGTGFSDGRYKNVTSMEEIAKLPYLKISRSRLSIETEKIPGI